METYIIIILENWLGAFPKDLKYCNCFGFTNLEYIKLNITTRKKHDHVLEITWATGHAKGTRPPYFNRYTFYLSSALFSDPQQTERGHFNF